MDGEEYKESYTVPYDPDKDGQELEIYPSYMNEAGQKTSQNYLTITYDHTCPIYKTEEKMDGLRIRGADEKNFSSENQWKTMTQNLAYSEDRVYKKVFGKMAATDDLSVTSYVYVARWNGSKNPLTEKELNEKEVLTEGTFEDRVYNGFVQSPSLTIKKEGQYVIYVYSVDAAGNRSDYICSDVITIDHTAPEISLQMDGETEWTMADRDNINPGDAYTSRSIRCGQSIGVVVGDENGADDVASIKYMVYTTDVEANYGPSITGEKDAEALAAENGGWKDYKEPFTFSKNRGYVYVAKVSDRMGNTNYMWSPLLRTDVNAPVVELEVDGTTYPAEVSDTNVYDDSVTIRVVSYDTPYGSGIDGVTYRLDGDTTDRFLRPPYELTIDTAGKHTVTVTVRDRTGNSTTKKITVKVFKETTAVMTGKTVTSDGKSIESGKDFTLDTGGNEGKVTYFYKQSGAGDETWQKGLPVNAGTYTIKADIAEDINHYLKPCSVTCEVVITAAKPTTCQHSWDSGKITREATDTKEGQKLYTCKKCGKTKTESIPKLAFSLVKASAGKTSITLKWKKVSDADGYLIYGGRCGKDAKLLKKVSAKTLEYKKTKLSKGKYYKFYVVAYKNVDGKQKHIYKTLPIHVVTKGRAYGNPSKVKINKSTVNVKVKKTVKLKAKVSKWSGKAQKHVDAIRYKSTNTGVATVTSKGVIKGVKKGTCYVYCIAQNGIYKKVKVVVK